MLQIHTTSNGTIEWNVGDTAPVHNHQIPSVVHIEASAAELEFVRDMYNNKLPIPNSSIVKWYGDIAKQIVSCLG